LSVFVDSSIWFAAVVESDRDNERARSILTATTGHVTTDHVLVETWLLLNSRCHRKAAEDFWEKIRDADVRVELISAADLESAWVIGLAFADQKFSIVDRTSFAVAERLGITQVASLDPDFVVYRYGPNRERAFEIVR